MCAKIALAQMNASDNPTDNLKTIEQYAVQAHQKGADLLVLPEYSMAYPQHGQPFPKGQSLQDYFCVSLCELARTHGIYIICGMLEKNDTDKPYNTTVVVDRQGKIVRTHRKTHLFSSSHYREDDHFLQGDALFEPLVTDFGRIGLLICYEIRFPELARLQALQGAEILIVSSAFVAGENKTMQWHTLLQARAIENAVFVCASNHSKPHVFLGESCAYDPNGLPLGGLTDGEGMLMVSCAAEDLGTFRQTNAAILQRRPELYRFACEKPV
ncbi:MAG: nitrilase-related carbon-nitrogen hydrolase [Butyricicoccus sp.]|nr:nitrilase-related carbon-nitrogen hydrolase [Butyricicoccus sp.]